MRLWRSLREILGDGERMRTILHLAWPTVVEQALQTVHGYVEQHAQNFRRTLTKL